MSQSCIISQIVQLLLYNNTVITGQPPFFEHHFVHLYNESIFSTVSPGSVPLLRGLQGTAHVLRATIRWFREVALPKVA